MDVVMVARSMVCTTPVYYLDICRYFWTGDCINSLHNLVYLRSSPQLGMLHLLSLIHNPKHDTMINLAL